MDGLCDRVEHKYNRQGQVIETKDQNETVHSLQYDLLGRHTADEVTAVGSGVDDGVRKIVRSYEVRNLLERVPADAASCFIRGQCRLRCSAGKNLTR